MLLGVDEARDRLLAALKPLEAQTIPLEEAVGRILAVPIHSDLELPPFSNSSMDGFAVRSRDVTQASRQSPVVLDVVGDIPAGKPADRTVSGGETMRIMTGAPMPSGADAVVPVEDTDHQSLQAGSPSPANVMIFRSIKAGDFVRVHGEDLRSGDQVLRKGHRIRSQDLGMLATLGYSTVRVYRKPRVALLSTGDELLPVEAPIQPGMIRESNSYTLAAQVASCSGEALRLGIVPDDEEAVRAHLDQAVETGADLIISSAGVSVGSFDFVRTVVEQYGQLEFWRVNMRPGKPLAFGSYREVPLIGLPGNPVSAFVGYEVFARPAVYWLAGFREWQRATLTAQLLEEVASDGRESYMRGIISRQNGRWVARLTGHQGSGNLFSLVQANALLIVPAGVSYLPVGADVEVWQLE